MKMTFDLPEELIKEIKIRAINEDKTYKQKFTELFRIGLTELKRKNKTAGQRKRK